MIDTLPDTSRLVTVLCPPEDVEKIERLVDWETRLRFRTERVARREKRVRAASNLLLGIALALGVPFLVAGAWAVLH